MSTNKPSNSPIFQTMSDSGVPQVIVNVPDTHRSQWIWRIVMMVLFFGFFLAVTQISPESSSTKSVVETFYSGSKDAEDKIARIEVTGTIMAPFTAQTIREIKEAVKDKDVKGVMLAVNSPGGVVTGSHQIYHELKKLSEKKPVYVSMKDMAASGGYYISMGAGPKGKIYAEPTTWTGSIGVILPFYNASGMAEKLGIASEPLKTGPLKGSLNPFRNMTEEEKQVWTEILDDSFDRFLTIIDENRDTLDRTQVEELATGQVYTATQAKENGLIDEIGFEEQALEALQKELKLTKVQVITYTSPPTMLDALIGNVEASTPESQWRQLMEMTVPKAMYYCSWLPVMPGTR